MCIFIDMLLFDELNTCYIVDAILGILMQGRTICGILRYQVAREAIRVSMAVLFMIVCTARYAMLSLL